MNTITWNLNVFYFKLHYNFLPKKCLKVDTPELEDNKPGFYRKQENN